MTTVLPLVAATAVFAWGVWDYFHSDRPSSAAFVKAVIGIGAIGLLILRSVA